MDDERLAMAADELYGAPVADFVQRRDALVRKAKQDGDAVLAAGLARLRRPTAGARLANLLVREHRAQVEELVDLGSALREAQDDLDPEQLRALGRQRQQVVQALVELGLGSAAASGEPTGPAAAQELGDTLTAALADPDAATQLLTGRLSTGLRYAGLGFGEAAAPRGPAGRETGSLRSLGTARAKKEAAGGSRTGAASDKAARGSGTTTAVSREQAAKERAAAKAAAAQAAKVDAAERDLAQARLQAAEAEARLDEVTEQVSAADRALEEVRARLQDARASVAALEDEERAAVEARTAAARQQAPRTRAAAQAERTAERAAKALEALRSKG